MKRVVYAMHAVQYKVRTCIRIHTMVLTHVFVCGMYALGVALGSEVLAQSTPAPYL